MDGAPGWAPKPRMIPSAKLWVILAKPRNLFGSPDCGMDWGARWSSGCFHLPGSTYFFCLLPFFLPLTSIDIFRARRGVGYREPGVRIYGGRGWVLEDGGTGRSALACALSVSTGVARHGWNEGVWAV